MTINGKEMIEREIRSYENDVRRESREAFKHQVLQECYAEFIGVLKNILNELEKED